MAEGDAHVLRMTVVTISAKQDHDITLRATELESAVEEAMEYIGKLQRLLDDRKSVRLPHPEMLYPPERILSVAFEFRPPGMRIVEIADFMERMASRQIDRPIAGNQ